MTPAAGDERCAICGNVPHASERRVLVVGRARQSYCSPSCLRIGVRAARIAARKARLRRWAWLVSIALAVAGAGWVRHLVRRPRLRRPAPTVAAPVATAPPEPVTFGPDWPPTDDQWREQLTRPTWVYPLPGPRRRPPVSTAELVPDGPAPQARCRTAGRCGVDLGGELWGEHVYAAHEGVVDRLRRSDDAPGGIYVRVAHLGGAVFTHYYHLAAVPTRLSVGMHVEAGDVIGLVGDTGVADGRARLRFALSVRPSSALPDVYWDPAPLMAGWALRTPARGSVAGLVAADAPPEHVAGTPSVIRRPPRPPRPRRSGAATSAD